MAVVDFGQRDSLVVNLSQRWWERRKGELVDSTKKRGPEERVTEKEKINESQRSSTEVNEPSHKPSHLVES